MGLHIEDGRPAAQQAFYLRATTAPGDTHNSITENQSLRNAWGILLFRGDGAGSTGNKIARNLIIDNGRSGIDVFEGNHDNFINQNDAKDNASLSNGTFDLNDQGDLDNTWLDNLGGFNH